MSSPINNQRFALERVLEKTLEDTQRDLAAFLKARGAQPSLDPREGERGEPGPDGERGAGERSNQSQDQSFAETPRPPRPRLVASAPAQPSSPTPAALASLVAAPPQAFLTPGHVAVPSVGGPPVADLLPPAVSSLIQGEAERLRGAPVVPAPRAEPGLAERLIAERRPQPDWPPVPPVQAVAPPPVPAPFQAPRLSALVPRKVQDRIDEFYRTGTLSEEPFHFDPVEPIPGPARPAQLLRSGLGLMEPQEGPRSGPVEAA